jgi:macrolide transport system ATP-binding/permease protein
VLEVHGLSKLFSTPRGEIAALADIDLQVEPGTFLAVCGHSGSGKSTLLGILGGLARPSQGSVSIDGVNILALGARELADFRNTHVGFIFQCSSLLSNLRAIDNVALPALIGAKHDTAAAYERAQQMLERVGLGDRWDAFPGELSGGQQRRVAIARALVNEPRLILADEPTNDLDAAAEREIFSLLVELHKTTGSTLILVTHNTRLAQHADRVIDLQQGRIVSHSASIAVTPTITPVPIATAALAPLDAAPAAVTLREEQPVPLGAGLPKFLCDFLGWTVAATVAILAVNYATACFQKQSMAQELEVRRKVEELALQTLRADVENVEYQSDGIYQVTLYLLNPDTTQSLFVMGPTLRAFLQVDQSWQAIDLSPLENPAGKVRQIAGRALFKFALRVNQDRYDQLMKGYMHIRLTNSMIVADSEQPKGDLFDRTDDYYIYLKPQNLSEDEIRTLNGWKSGGIVPRWIAMPAH